MANSTRSSVLGGQNMISKLSRMNDEQLIEYYLKLKITLSKTTLRNYKALLRQFSEFCVDRGSRIRDATQIDIGEFLNQFEYRSTKDTYRIILNIFFKWMFKHHLINYNPVEEIRITNGKKNKQELMRDSDFKQIVSRCEGLREITIVHTLWYLGLRAKELRGLRLEDIDLDRGMLFVSQSKTINGYRSIPIHPNFKSLLSKYLTQRQNIQTTKPWLFLTKRGTQFSESALIQFIRNVQLDLGFRYSCHDFRRAFVTRLYRKTTDLVLCQRLAGHASIKTTRRYIIDDIEEHMRKFNALNF